MARQHFARVSAAAVGIGMVLAGAMGAPILALVLLLGAQVPDAYDAPSDPCCSSPDTWGESLGAAGIVLVLVFAAGAGLGIAAALLRWGIIGRPTRPKTVFLRIPAALTGAAAVAIASLFIWQRDRVRLATNCDRYAFSEAAWQSTEPPDWKRQARGLSDCGTLQHRTASQVRQTLGSPEFRRTFPANQYGPKTVKWGYRDALYVDFVDGHVVQTAWNDPRN